ncbi:hypothetical protein [Massilia sp. YIM B04103]|uniref:hypothetical protein n=1 Tax=Massilia sp. YIM B04103 TaxID=2963106 RepID=UPI00210B79C6|nr:hypothetical protein [Massilia sp. YIM B04103]
MIDTIRQGLAEDGFKVSINKLCQWFDMPRRMVYYKSIKAAPKGQPRFADPIKAMVNEEPSFGYHTVAPLLGFNKNTVQRIFQCKRPVAPHMNPAATCAHSELYFGDQYDKASKGIRAERACGAMA